MKNYEIPERVPGGPIPKPKHTGPSHSDVLDKCIAIAEDRGYQWIHIPDVVYRLSAHNPADKLSTAIERALPFAVALAVKKTIADHLKGVLDLIVILPVGELTNVCLVGDVKVGYDHKNTAQRRFSRGIRTSTWGSVDEYLEDLGKLERVAMAMETAIDGLEPE